MKTILLWNSPNRDEVASFGRGHQPFIDHGCPVTNCYIQANSSEFQQSNSVNNSEILLKSFDAVLINVGVGELWLSLLSKYERPSSQRFVWIQCKKKNIKKYGSNSLSNSVKLFSFRSLSQVM